MKSEIISLLNNLKKDVNNEFGKRIIAQLVYALKISKINDNKYDVIIEKAIIFINKHKISDNYISEEIVKKAENIIQDIAKEAKSYTMICAAHAHIDMNWTWDYSETVAITLDTMRTMLELMDEYPEFVFSQSQASIFKIIEEHDKDMLNEIKKRVKQGRFEITASTWVEADKNMPNGESHVRHILYTKKYLTKLFDLDKNSLQIDFEPDTFGHNINVPEILTKGGVKYYYHCRGYEGHHLYRYQSPSGNNIIVYRDPLWYNAMIDENIAIHVPEFCDKYGIKNILKVYGVGDHGGGPTRRDIEKIKKMSKWPVFPTIKFGTYKEFFNYLDKIAEKLPIVTNEANFIFTGCYTTQTRIKLANRISEAKLAKAETLSTLSHIFVNGKYPSDNYKVAWQKTLFSQFHDILTGSGVTETREYAMGQFQKVCAYTNTGASNAMRDIATNIDTTKFLITQEESKETTSEGAGVGYAINKFELPQTERGRGKIRIFHVFNSTWYKREEIVTLTIWDWIGNEEAIEFRDGKNEIVPFQIIKNKSNEYGGHTYMTILIKVIIPAFGYNTYVLYPKNIEDIKVKWPKDPRKNKKEQFILENDYVKIIFDSTTLNIVSYINKKDNTQFIGNIPSGVFRIIDEDDSKGMTAWTIGRYANITKLNTNIRVIATKIGSDYLKQWIEYEIKFRNSTLKVIVSLNKNTTRIDYEVECDWQETSKKGQLMPQLNFHVPFNFKSEKYKYDIPFGILKRQEMNMDVPGNSFMIAIPNSGNKSLMLLSNCKYGFRGIDNSMALTLIRSSYSPDKYPDNGIHKFKLAIDMVNSDLSAELIKKSYSYNHPLSYVSSTVQKGTLPLMNSFISIEKGNIIISAIKMSEDNKKMIIRLYEVEGKNEETVFNFQKTPIKSYFVDINEEKYEDGEKILQKENKIGFVIPPYNMVTICIEF